MARLDKYLCQLVGAGPAGVGFLQALHNQLASCKSKHQSYLKELVKSLIVIEAEANAGGILGHYQINANTDAADSVSSINDNTPFENLRDDFLRMPEVEQTLISLPRLQSILLNPMADEVVKLLGEQLKLNSKVVRVEKTNDLFTSYDENLSAIAQSRNMVLCCGGREELLTELTPWREKVAYSGDFLRIKSLETLPNGVGPIVITSASHSGFSCAWRLLRDPLFEEYVQDRQLVILHRRRNVKLRCDEAFAIQHKIDWQQGNDVCPRTGLIFANGGLRKDAKYLYLAIRDGVEKRARLLPIDSLAEESVLLDQAGLVIQCAGFKASLPEIVVQGRKQKINNHSIRGEVTDSISGNVIDGLFAFGLGMHILPDGKYRGEKSFNGSINGLLSYPRAIAPAVIHQLLENIANLSPVSEC